MHRRACVGCESERIAAQQRPAANSTSTARPFAFRDCDMVGLVGRWPRSVSCDWLDKRLRLPPRLSKPPRHRFSLRTSSSFLFLAVQIGGEWELTTTSSLTPSRAPAERSAVSCSFVAELMSVVKDKVLPVLSERHLTYKIHETDASTSGSGSIARDIVSDCGESTAPTKVIVAGGDGTAHELIDGVLSSPSRLGRWELIVLPLGTVSCGLSVELMPGKRAAFVVVPSVSGG